MVKNHVNLFIKYYIKLLRLMTVHLIWYSILCILLYIYFFYIFVLNCYMVLIYTFKVLFEC
jgi:hypothetical protein